MKIRNQNPLLALEHPIPFDRIDAQHIEPAIDHVLAAGEATLVALESATDACTYDNTLGAFERMERQVVQLFVVARQLESVASTDAIRAAVTAAQAKVSAFQSRTVLSSPLWDRLRSFAETDEAKALDPTRSRLLEKTLDRFVRAGATLPADAKARLAELNIELAGAAASFRQNCLDATNAVEVFVEEESRLGGLPAHAVAAARQSAERQQRAGYRFTLDAPSLGPVLTYADDEALRREMTQAHFRRASEGRYDNRDVILQMLKLRAEQARLLQYPNFVDWIVADRIAQSSERVATFLKDLQRRARPAFECEQQDLKAFRAAMAGDAESALGEIPIWSNRYYEEKQRRATLNFDSELLRPYFSVDRVLDGLFELLRRLFAITVDRVEDVPTWHPSVRTYRVGDEDGSVLGYVYADLFPREQKRAGAYMCPLLIAEPTESTWSPAAGLLVANLTPPIGDAPALLSHNEVVTIFHEFGHMLHHILSRVTVPSLASTRVAWDFVELPSQIMENWCWERESLDLIARHVDDDSTIPDDLLAALQRSRTYRSATKLMRQVGQSMLDLRLHTDFDPERDGDVFAFSRRVEGEHVPVTLPPWYAAIASFRHLFSDAVGYAGGYYSYAWAAVLDADAFSRFKTAGLFSSEVGKEFRDKILARGNSRDPMDLYRDFMGREPDQQPLLERYGIA
ncbi:MAG: M3 family metallopeptidase [Planctomycetota bacterium]